MTDQGPYRYYDPAKIKGRRSRWIWIVAAVILAVFVLWLVAPKTDPATANGPGGPGGAQASSAGGRSGGGVTGGGGRGGGRGGRSGGAPATVGSAKATAGDAPIYLYALGTATPPQTVTIRTQISGQLQAVGFHEGQLVKKGQFLAQIDPRPYEQQLAQAQANQAKDQAQLANARIDLQRYKTLLAQDSIARQQVDTQAALVRQLEAQVKADEAAVGTQRLNITYTHIVSPITGRVGLRQVDPGNYVTPGDSNGIVVVTQEAPMDVLFTVPEDSLAQVSAGIRKGPLEAVALDRTQTNQLAVGRLLTLDNQVDTTTGTVRAKARFDNASGALYPNQFVNIRLLVETLHGVVLAPTSAVLRGNQGLFVWVVNPDRTAEMRSVKTGPAVGDNTAILSGLDAGETVVTDGSDRLRDGQRVFIAGDCIPSGFGRGGAGRGAGPGGPSAGGKAAGTAPPAAPATTPAAPQKSLFNLWGLLSPKPTVQPDPMAELRCKPGQRPQRLGGGGWGGGAGMGAAASGQASGASAYRGGRHGDGQGGQGGQGAGGQGAAFGASQTAAGPSSMRPQASGQSSGPQGSGQAGGQGGGGRGGRTQAMFDQLNLDPAQKAKVDAIMAELRPKMMAAYQSGDMDAARAARQDMSKRVDAVLRPDQRAKMAELRAQMGGGGGQGGQ